MAEFLHFLVLIILISSHLTECVVISNPTESEKENVKENSTKPSTLTEENINSLVYWDTINSIQNEKISNYVSFRPAEPLNPSEYDEAEKLTKAELEPESKSPVSTLEHPSRVAEFQTKNGLLDKTRRWPYATVPYLIADEFDSSWRRLFARSFREFHKYTCVRFTPRRNQRDYIVLVNGTGCDSDAGRMGGEQTVALGPGCFSLSTVVHELVHALGFWHEQNRYDRDDHIKIHWDNIIPDMKFNFEKLEQEDVTDFGVPYDTDSIMHYDQWAFSVDYGNPEKVVMTPHKPNPNMGLAEHFSKNDIKKINRMYECNNEISRPNNFYPVVPQMTKGFRNANDEMDCKDFHGNCTEFVKQNDCNTNSMWMNVNCRKSCNKCGMNSANGVCEDMRPECVKWAQANKCETDREYMNMYCTKSCNACTFNNP